MTSLTPGTWSLDDLRKRVEEVLFLDPVDGDDGRVSPVPSTRTIRYYQSLGLVDKPSHEGNRALYTKRHLLQVIAVKRLQARGLNLTEVAECIYRRSNPLLQRIACLPSMDELAAARDKLDARRARFWSADVVPAVTQQSQRTWIELGPDSILLFRSGPLSPEDEEALHAAAKPLLKLLKTFRRGTQP